MKPKIYISVGSAATPTQSQAADAIFGSLEAAGLSPRRMDKNEWSAEQPLRAIKRVINQCAGIVVIAFARYEFPKGTERQKDGSEKQLTDVRITTAKSRRPWHTREDCPCWLSQRMGFWKMGSSKAGTIGRFSGQTSRPSNSDQSDSLVI
jgi:hypothetical protein